MTATDPVALDRFLAGLEWVVHRTRRAELEPGQGLLVPGRQPCLVYVDGGSVALEHSGPRHESVNDCPDGGRSRLDSGDILLVAPQAAASLQAISSARVVLVELRLPPVSEAAAADLPTRLLVRDFDRLEPHMAAVAASMGGSCDRTVAGGEGTVCSRIVTAIIAVAMRSWSLHGCAPDEWPLRSRDPLLARALDAIHADPAQPWTVADLATVATMSRSVFAERFRQVLGRSPAHYVAEVRMTSAKRYLGRTG